MTQAALAINQDDQNRGALARMVTRAFEHWKLGTEAQLAMLGLATNNRTALSRYRRGAPLAANRDLLERAGHVLAIHKNLRLIFPQDRDLAYAWMTQRNKAFEGRTPVDVIREWGFAGMLMVRSYLDRVRGN
jgi:hypothetical protein